MPLTHLSTVGYQSSPVVRSTIDTVSLSLSPFFLHLFIPMFLTHLSSTAYYQSPPAVRSMIDTVSPSLSIFPSSLHTHASHPSQQYRQLSVVTGDEVNDWHGFSPFFPLFLSLSLSLSLLSSHLHRAILLRRLHQPPSTKPYFHHLTTATPIAIILGAHHRQPLIATILASPHLFSIHHLWSSFPCSHDYHHYSLPLFLSQASTTAPQHTTTNSIFACGETTRKKKLIKWELWISYSLNLFF